MEQNDAGGNAYSWRSDYQLIGGGLAALLLLIAALADSVYSIGFYTLLRLAVTAAAAAFAWRSHQQHNALQATVNGLIAVLFNPIMPIELDRSTWQPIDFIVALWFGWVAMEHPAAARGRPALRFAPAGVLVGLIVLVGLVGLISNQSSPSYSGQSYEMSEEMNDVIANVASPPPTIRTSEQKLADAFKAATGVDDEFVEVVDGEMVTTRPLKIISLPFGSALLTKREIKDGCHACTGAIGVFYIKEEGEQTSVTGRWPEAVKGWGWGAPPAEWELTDKFTANPAIYASGGFMGQGIVMESATVTELTPSGPKTSDYIGTGFSDEGAIVDESRPACIVSGKIANIRKDRSFDVVVSGAVTALDHYVKKNGQFVKSKSIDWGVPCSHETAPVEEPL